MCPVPLSALLWPASNTGWSQGWETRCGPEAGREQLQSWAESCSLGAGLPLAVTLTALLQADPARPACLPCAPKLRPTAQTQSCGNVAQCSELSRPGHVRQVPSALHTCGAQARIIQGGSKRSLEKWHLSVLRADPVLAVVPEPVRACCCCTGGSEWL